MTTEQAREIIKEHKNLKNISYETYLLALNVLAGSFAVIGD